jgi:ubiquinone/menaquinone biosynthesis C-methylase UbiE
MLSPAERVLYGVTQAARVGWFAAHYLLARRLSTSEAERRKSSRARPEIRAALRRELIALFRRDLANIEAGHYKLPYDLIPNPMARLRQSVRFFADLPDVDRRRRARRADEPFRRNAPADLPRYYLQNFHYQSGGWLTPESALLYDTQVEVLFTGAADAMRRQALVPIGEFLKDRMGSEPRLLDVGCGTGRLLGYVKDNWPSLAATGLDLSQPYLDAAARHLRRFSQVEMVAGAAEAMPLPSAGFDIVSCTYLLHELPRKVRTRVAVEVARVLKPGGRFILVDSLQKGDKPLFDVLLAAFPATFHEPYFADYGRTDLARLFGTVGLRKLDSWSAFLSKIVVFEKL